VDFNELKRIHNCVHSKQMQLPSVVHFFLHGFVRTCLEELSLRLGYTINRRD
jgi:hypothetical protein